MTFHHSRNIDIHTAVGIAEGFIQPETNDPETEILEAWQYLIDTGACWTLQGWFGRTASALIEAGICSPADSTH